MSTGSAVVLSHAATPPVARVAPNVNSPAHVEASVSFASKPCKIVRDTGAKTTFFVAIIILIKSSCGFWDSRCMV